MLCTCISNVFYYLFFLSPYLSFPSQQMDRAYAYAQCILLLFSINNVSTNRSGMEPPSSPPHPHPLPPPSNFSAFHILLILLIRCSRRIAQCSHPVICVGSNTCSLRVLPTSPTLCSPFYESISIKDTSPHFSISLKKYCIITQ
jgi:hypothetical protein